jgi:hypothetical protein
MSVKNAPVIFCTYKIKRVHIISNIDNIDFFHVFVSLKLWNFRLIDRGTGLFDWLIVRLIDSSTVSTDSSIVYRSIHGYNELLVLRIQDLPVFARSWSLSLWTKILEFVHYKVFFRPNFHHKWYDVKESIFYGSPIRISLMRTETTILIVIPGRISVRERRGGCWMSWGWESKGHAHCSACRRRAAVSART